MNEFNIIVVMNESMLKLLQSKNKDFEINLKIKEALKDESLFFRIRKSNAYKILKNVGIKETQLENVYQKLISSEMFYDLLNKGKIDKNDNNLVIKYRIFGNDDLFRKSNKN